MDDYQVPSWKEEAAVFAVACASVTGCWIFPVAVIAVGMFCYLKNDKIKNLWHRLYQKQGRNNYDIKS